MRRVLAARTVTGIGVVPDEACVEPLSTTTGRPGREPAETTPCMAPAEFAARRYIRFWAEDRVCT